MNIFQKTSLVFLIAATITGSAWGAIKTIVLDVPGMTCPVCPITVKKALQKVPGVSRVDVNYAKKQATVTFDDSKANTQSLVKATTNAGYPSKPEAMKQ